jgi:hypothetical protein
MHKVTHSADLLQAFMADQTPQRESVAGFFMVMV